MSEYISQRILEDMSDKRSKNIKDISKRMSEDIWKICLKWISGDRIKKISQKKIYQKKYISEKSTKKDPKIYPKKYRKNISRDIIKNKSERLLKNISNK